MNGAILIFKNETKEIIELLYHKLSLMRSPVQILNESEVNDIEDLIFKYSVQVDKLNTTNEFIKENNQKITNKEIENYNQILKEYNHIKKKFDRIIDDYMKDKINNPVKTFNRSEDRESSSEMSEYNSKHGIQILKIFLNSIVSVSQVKELHNKKTLNQEILYIAEIFNLNKDSNKDNIIIDFYKEIYKFCLKNDFTLEKISTFLSIMFFIFNYSVKNKKIIREDSFNLFIQVLDYHCFNKPPYFFEIFNLYEKELILKFVNETFYRNYPLYENIFKYNKNINIYSKSFPKMGDPLSKLKILSDDNFVEDIDSIEVLKLYFDPNQKKKTLEKKEKDIKIDEFSKYEEETLEKMRKFVNSISKASNDLEIDKKNNEKEKENKILEYEKNEANNFMNEKITEILKDTNENISLLNKKINEITENSLSHHLKK